MGLFDRVTERQISIHALREESDLKITLPREVLSYISIHALREESDAASEWSKIKSPSISIHALREESDNKILHILLCFFDFNPRSP